jgi:hypothetical protein
MAHSNASSHPLPLSSSHSSVPQLEYRHLSHAGPTGNEISGELDGLHPSAVHSGPDPDLTSSSHRSSGALNYPSNRAMYASSSRIRADNQHFPSGYQSAGFESAPHPVQSPPESHPKANSAFPWNHPSNSLTTSINGGTFIGNLNNIQPQGKTGEFG